MARPKKNLYDKVDPFAEENSATAVTDEIFGAPRVEGLGGKRTVARDIPLDKIWLDPTQPRRTIPMSMRKDWDGDPSKIEALLTSWSQDVKMWLKKDERLSWYKVLRGEDIVDLDKENAPPLMQTFIGLIELAMSIRDSGLNNAITVSKQDKQRYILHTGERRLIATHMLKYAMGDDYKSVQAIERDFDVWTQIEENTQREQMNAISMCRSLAKLIMDMYKDEIEFKPYSAMVTKAGCDRPYYAQVADLRIKQGMGDRILTAMNVTTRAYIRYYRNILNLNDDVWLTADQNNWTEWKIRHILQLPYDMQPEAINWSTGRIEEWIEEQKLLTGVNNLEEQDRFTIVNRSDDAFPQDEQKRFTMVNLSDERTPQDDGDMFTPVNTFDGDQGHGDEPPAPKYPWQQDTPPDHITDTDKMVSNPSRTSDRVETFLYDGWKYGDRIEVIHKADIYYWNPDGHLVPNDYIIDPNTKGIYKESLSLSNGAIFDVILKYSDGRTAIIREGLIKRVPAPAPPPAPAPAPRDKGIERDNRHSANLYMNEHSELFAVLQVLWNKTGHAPFNWISRLTEEQLADYTNQFGVEAVEEEFMKISAQTSEQFSKIHADLAEYLERLYSDAKKLKE